ncbi:Predicted arabinose efflux permease, MFS family [Amycolatopsis arida]|uniref:Predicted arabinose efflux permease, MFS family n=1 Tax=Amycolatopsis arida TaxID=587909 RepID=A0A1I5M0Q9_9PSEU|nr:MFS transporter [Amycolatopsis arida]TDX93922.1 putative MFS family arabinose efflux permease [Amycolatopsis arida]SFP03112.1 Predicted arabinose efflux permease, MFS family [Amycolatopsis arida]
MSDSAVQTPARRTAVLALGTFAAGTSGYVVAGLLPALSTELAVSPAAAAQLVTAFAIAYAVGSPLLAAATGRWERRKLLVAALLVMALGNALAAVLPGYAALFGARMVTAAGAALYTPVASAVAGVLNPPERRGRAVAIVFGGLTVATVLGVPLGSLLSQYLGYRWVFALVAVFSVVAATAVHVAVPRVAAPPPVRLAERFAVARDPRALALLATTVLGVLAAFSVYTFIAPVLGATAGIGGTALSVLLFCYGVGGALGNVLGGVATDRWGARRPLLVVIAALTVVLAALPAVATTPVGAGVLLFVWGVGTWSFNPPMQHRLIELSPGAGGLLLSLNASAIYLGVGLSGVVGGLVLGHGGPLLLPEVAALLTAASGVVVLLFGWRARVATPAVP